MFKFNQNWLKSIKIGLNQSKMITFFDGFQPILIDFDIFDLLIDILIEHRMNFIGFYSKLVKFNQKLVKSDQK